MTKIHSIHTKSLTTHVSTRQKTSADFSDLFVVVILIPITTVSDSAVQHLIAFEHRNQISFKGTTLQQQINNNITIMMRLSNTTRLALILAAALLACLSMETESFSTSAPLPLSRQGLLQRPSLLVVQETSDEESSTEDEPKEKMSLEEKMKSWEASEEELKAASLGGVIPQSRERTGAFDVGLYIAFPIMVLTGLAFAFFPFIMGNIDVSDIVVPTE